MYRESAERAASMLLRYKDCIRRYKSRTEDRGRKFKVLGSLREYESENTMIVNDALMRNDVENEATICKKKYRKRSTQFFSDSRRAPWRRPTLRPAENIARNS